mmetsp:Transcript_5469/g.15365  ORF Transcript_5469/g.15365 Transcript_5469/m.15365 type:complete len:214 (-) Transcript_5469:63-704(-)
MSPEPSSSMSSMRSSSSFLFFRGTHKALRSTPNSSTSIAPEPSASKVLNVSMTRCNSLSCNSSAAAFTDCSRRPSLLRCFFWFSRNLTSLSNCVSGGSSAPRSSAHFPPSFSSSTRNRSACGRRTRLTTCDGNLSTNLAACFHLQSVNVITSLMNFLRLRKPLERLVNKRSHQPTSLGSTSAGSSTNKPCLRSFSRSLSALRSCSSRLPFRAA